MRRVSRDRQGRYLGPAMSVSGFSCMKMMNVHFGPPIYNHRDRKTNVRRGFPSADRRYRMVGFIFGSMGARLTYNKSWQLKGEVIETVSVHEG